MNEYLVRIECSHTGRFRYENIRANNPDEVVYNIHAQVGAQGIKWEDYKITQILLEVGV